MNDYANMTIQEMSKLPGIDGLKTNVKVKFIKALKAEAQGKHDEAKAALDEAVALEQAAQ